MWDRIQFDGVVTVRMRVQIVTGEGTDVHLATKGGRREWSPVPFKPVTTLPQ